MKVQTLMGYEGSHRLYYEVLERLETEGREWGLRVECAAAPSGTCFANALELAIRTPGLRYCEGAAWCRGMELPFHHAWCVTEAGEVVDPTWPDADRYLGIALERDEAERAYRSMAGGKIGSVLGRHILTSP